MKIAQKVIEAYMLGNYYTNKNDKLRYDSDTECIYDSSGTLIAEFRSLEDERGNYQLFLVVNDFTIPTNKTWEKYKLELARAANEAGLRVVLEQLDIGFGKQKIIVDKDELCKHLIKIAKYSQDNDVQTSVRVSNNEYCVYSYNQLVNGEFMHAERVALDFLKLSYRDSSRQREHIYCLYEPCENCLSLMKYAESIIIHHVHKKKWETQDYRTLFFDIKTGRVRNVFDRKIFICFEKNKLVDKFYKGKVNI